MTGHKKKHAKEVIISGKSNIFWSNWRYRRGSVVDINGLVFETHSITVVTATQENLVELRVVEKVGPVSMNQGAESQAVLPATSANQQREPTCQTSSLHS